MTKTADLSPILFAMVIDMKEVTRKRVERNKNDLQDHFPFVSLIAMTIANKIGDESGFLFNNIFLIF